MCRRRLVSLMRCRNECIAAKTAGDARSIATNETYDSLKGMNLLPAVLLVGTGLWPEQYS